MKKSLNQTKKIESMPIAIKLFKGFKVYSQNKKSKNVNAYWVSTPGEDVWVKVINLDAFKGYDIVGYAEADSCTQVYRFGTIAVIISSEMLRYDDFVDYSKNGYGEHTITMEMDQDYVRIVVGAELVKDNTVALESAQGERCTDLEIQFRVVKESQINAENNFEEVDDILDALTTPTKVFIEDFKTAA